MDLTLESQLRTEIEALRTDAERYRYLREQCWWKSEFCVVMNPKQAVKLGEYCPYGSRLDLEVDRARA